MVCEIDPDRTTAQGSHFPGLGPLNGSTKSLRSSAVFGRGDHLPDCPSGCFRPDAALLPLLPREDHARCCDCERCTRHAHLQNHR